MPVLPPIDKVTVVIVTFNSAAVLKRCLASLPPGVEVIVADNNSTDDTVDVTKKAGFTVIRLSENRGYGSAANKAIAAAQTDFVFLVNPDILLAEDCLEQLSRAVDRNPNAAMWGPRQSDENGRVVVPGARYAIGETGPAEGDYLVKFLVGSALFMDRAKFNRIGGFDENFFLFFEENDLCDRFRAKGYDLVFVDQAHIVHREGTSTVGVNHLEVKRMWHLGWSKQYIRRKNNQPGKASHLIIAGMLKVLFATLIGNKKGRRQYWGRLMGTIDFLRGVKAQDRKMN